jgi:transposase-like protein
MVASRGVLVSDETVRRWCDKFGQEFAAGLWRAVNQNGVVMAWPSELQCVALLTDSTDT